MYAATQHTYGMKKVLLTTYYYYGDCRDNRSTGICTDDMDYYWYTGIHGCTEGYRSGL